MIMFHICLIVQLQIEFDMPENQKPTTTYNIKEKNPRGWNCGKIHKMYGVLVKIIVFYV